MTHKLILKVKKLSGTKRFDTVKENLQGVDSTPPPPPQYRYLWVKYEVIALLLWKLWWFKLEIQENALFGFNPIQAGGGGTMCPPYRFFSCCAETVSSRLMKLSDL